MKLCVCLTEKDTHDCLDFLSTCDAELVEHRMDFLKTKAEFSEIYSYNNTPIIATCRPISEGGKFTGSETERIDLLIQAIESGASFVDVEIDTGRNDLNRIRQSALDNGCKVIVSKHYLESTPSFSELVEMSRRMADTEADIIKIVVFPRTIEESERILDLYDVVDPFIELIAFGMGNLGTYTRVNALLLGAPFMYVSQDEGKEAAAGQLSLQKMREIVRVLP